MQERRWKIAAWLLIALFAVVAAATFRDYGVTWDEGLQAHYGELVVRYFASGFSDHRCNEFLNLRDYGPAFELFPPLVYQFVPDAKFEVRHLFIALSALLALIAILRIQTLTADWRAAFFSILALILIPQFYGHAFNNSKDIPFACAFAWGMWGIARCVVDDDEPWRRFVTAGVLIGLALAIRIAGVVLFGYAAAALIAAAPPKRAKTALQFGAMVATAWLVMTLLWPWAQQNPILHPLEALRIASAFPARSPMLFEGRVIWSDMLPRRYLAELLLLTTPIAIVALSLAGLGIDLAALRAGQRRERVRATLLACWILVPIAIFVVRPPAVYDGIRHFLFVLPGVAVAAGTAASRLLRSRSAFARILLAVVALDLASVVVHMVRLHPYQMTYFNALAGGVRNASRNFETDYWAASYREGMLWIGQHECSGNRTTRVLVAASRYAAACVLPYATPRTGIAFIDYEAPGALPARFDYYLATTRYGWARNFDATPITHVIGREGAVFSVIRGGCSR